VKNRLVGAGIGLALIIILILIVFGSKGEDKLSGLSDFKAVKELISKDDLDGAKDKIDEIAAEAPDSDMLGKVYFDLARAYEEKQDIVRARDVYRIILNKYQNVNNILEVQERLGRLNMEILFSGVITDEDVLYEIEPGDTLSKIAKKFSTTVDLIKASNSLESDTIHAHSKLKISKTTYKILIDRSQNLLTLLSGGEIVKAYTVSTGKDNSTPVGNFKIVNRIKNPPWYTKDRVIPSESPENILGSRWLGISKESYGIHGTIDPESVGQQSTDGCIRMLNPDVEELFAVVPTDTEVTIVE